MKITTIMAVVVSLLTLAMPTVAIANVDVDPVKLRPAVHLRAQRHVEHGPAAGAPNHPTPTPDTGRHLTKNAYGGFQCMDLPDGTMQCFGTPAIPPVFANGVGLTPGDILTAVREIGLPSLRINIQPSSATLVNFDTIFYARPQPFERNITLLGFNVALSAKPVAYTWHHGDGTTQTTRVPGRPFPAKDVTHRFMRPAKHVRPSVDVTYAVRYRVDADDWQTLAQTLRANGPAADLEVKEAIPVLTAG